MAGVIQAVIVFALLDFRLNLPVLGLIVSAVAIARAKRPASGAIVAGTLISWYVFFSVGISFLENFTSHVFGGEMAARFIGRADSPFRLEVGMASPGFAVAGFLAAWRGFEIRLGAIGIARVRPVWRGNILLCRAAPKGIRLAPG